MPKAEAQRWLLSSGHGGLFVRPFWVSDGGNSIKRTDFDVCWLKSCTVNASVLWDALYEQPGLTGLVTNGKGLGLRVTPQADVAAMLAQVRHVANDDKVFVRRPVAGARWWRLGPLTDAEAWHAAELVAACGLEPLRGELRFGRLGPFRSVVYFTAVGEPVRRSLDDGSWGSSAATLCPAEPPPQRPSGSQRPGPALSSQSTWAGPRAATPSGQSPSTPAFPAPAQLSSPTVQPWLPSTSVPGSTMFPSLPPPAVPGATPPAQPHDGRAVGRRGGRSAGCSAAGEGAAASAVLPSALEAQMADLVAEMRSLSQEVRSLRRENVELRRQLDLARGVQQHQPYALSSTLLPLPPPPPAFTPERQVPSGRTRMAGELSPEPAAGTVVLDAGGEVVMASGSPPLAADRKKGRRSLAMDVADQPVPGTQCLSQAPPGAPHPDDA